MQMQKKQVLKEDGRYLVFYHFPETATPEQSEIFAALAASTEAGAEGDNLPANPPSASHEENARV